MLNIELAHYPVNPILAITPRQIKTRLQKTNKQKIPT